MCGRFTQYLTWAELHRLSSLLLNDGRNLQARYNIAPTTTVDVIRLNAEGRQELVPMRWGLVPGWWDKPLNKVPATFNARIETVEKMPMFRDAWKKRRCIIPASGFFEWTGDKGAKIPHYFTASDGNPMAFAGLWDRWKNELGDEVLSCTIIVGEGNDWMQEFHDRSPVLLDPSDFEAWLNGTAGKEILRQPPVGAMREWIVSTRVNKSGESDDDPETVRPIE